MFFRHFRLFRVIWHPLFFYKIFGSTTVDLWACVVTQIFIWQKVLWCICKKQIIALESQNRTKIKRDIPDLTTWFHEIFSQKSNRSSERKNLFNGPKTKFLQKWEKLQHGKDFFRLFRTKQNGSKFANWKWNSHEVDYPTAQAI